MVEEGFRKGYEAGVTRRRVRKYWVGQGKAQGDLAGRASDRQLWRRENGFEHGIGLQASGEFADESDHGGMPVAVEAKGAHFRKGLLGAPVLKGDAIGGDEYAGAGFAKFAMDKDFLRRGFAEEREELRELRGRRSGEAADGDVHKTQTERFRAVTFVFAGVR